MLPPAAASPEAAASPLVPRKDRDAGGAASPPSICSFSAPAPPSCAAGAPPLETSIAFGIAAIDARLPQGGLAAHGLNEFKPGSAYDSGTALALMLTLAARMLAPSRPLLIVLYGRAEAEHGLPYGPGLRQLGLAADLALIARAPRQADALWALEEGLRSGALGAVLGLMDTGKSAIGVLPARRLVLAAHEGGTPCLLLTGAATQGLNVAHSRWRIAARPSAPHPFDPAAPGPRRCAVTLERCRHGPSNLSWTIEWQEAREGAGVRMRLVDDRTDRAPLTLDRSSRGGL